MLSRVAIFILLVLPILAEGVVGLPYALTQDGQTTRGVLAPPNPPPTLSMGSEDDQPFLSITVAPGERRSFVLSEGTLELHPRHMYEVTATIRRPAGTHIVLQRQDDHSLHLPPLDYRIMPLWEEITTFMIVPDGASETSLTLSCWKIEECHADVSADVQFLRVTDLGRVRDLPEPVTIWEFPGPYELVPSVLLELPNVLRPASSGLYRFRAQITLEAAGQLRTGLEQGENPRQRMRSTAYGHTFNLEAGDHQVECLYYVADRRFVNQWMRVGIYRTSLPATMTHVVLEQIAIEPKAASEARPQTPSRR